MKLILTFAGIMAVWTGLKFVFMVFKRLGSKNSMNDMIDKMEQKMEEGADQVAGYFRSQKKRKARKKKEDNKPIVTIR